MKSLTKKKTTLVVITMLLLLTTLLSVVYADENNNTKEETKTNTIPDFVDVPKNFWGYADIMEMVQMGYLKGVGNGKFNPNGRVTHAEFLTMIANMFYEVEGYPNIINKPWYYDNVRWVVERGIGNQAWQAHPTANMIQQRGSAWEGTFSVIESLTSDHYLQSIKEAMPAYNEPVTRNNMALYMYNIGFNSMGQVRSLPKPDVLIYEREGMYSDHKDEYRNKHDTHLNMKYPIEYNYKHGFLKGINAKGDFGGERFMTRAEAAAVLKRMYHASVEREQPTTFKEILVEHHYSKPLKKPSPRAKDPDNQNNWYWAEYDIKAVYRPGKLTNGKPNTPENREALLREVKELMPKDKHWADRTNFHDYEDATFNDTLGLGGAGGGCNGYAAFIATALFGQYAPFRPESDTTKGKSGDIYDITEETPNGPKTTHYAVITGKRNDGSQYDGLYYMTDGNNGGMIDWDWDNPYGGGTGEFAARYPESALFVLDESTYSYQ